MALVFMSGFEWNTLREFETQGGVLQSSPKRSGNYSVTFGTYNVLEKTLSQALTEAYVQFAFYPKQANPWCFFSLRKNGADLVSIRKNASGCLEVCQGWDGSVYCTGSTILQINTWYVIELHFKLEDENGLIEVRLDGISECSFSGDTKPGADADFNQMRWRAPSSYNDFNVDDIVVFDTSGEVNNSWPNGLKVVLLKPNADGGVNEWAPTPAGDHYACVAEVPPAETDYLRAESAELLEVLGLEDLPAEALSIKAVRLDFWGLKGSAQDPDRIQLGVRSDETDYLSGDKDLPLAQALIIHHLDQNPAGGNWSVSAVNGMQLVAKSRN